MKQGRFSNEQIVRILRETDQDSVAVVATRVRHQMANFAHF
jgi:PleD family two-component response regulator